MGSGTNCRRAEQNNKVNRFYALTSAGSRFVEATIIVVLSALNFNPSNYSEILIHWIRLQLLHYFRKVEHREHWALPTLILGTRGLTCVFVSIKL